MNRKAPILVRVAIVLFAVLLSAPCIYAAGAVEEPLRAILEFNSYTKCSIVNAEGEEMIYDFGECTGSMAVGEQLYSITSSQTRFIVNSSASFMYKRLTPNGKSYFGVQSKLISLVAETNNEDSITLCNEDGCKKAIISGTHVEFSVSMYAPNSGLKGVDITGTGSGNVVISDTQNGVLVSGATGEVSFVANDLNDSNGSIRKVEVIGLGGDILFYGSGKSPISVSGAVRLSSKWYNSVHGLHVCRMADPNRLLLYWNRVRPAAGYNIYRYDPESRSYNKIVSLAGKSSRAWVDGSAQQGKTYRYRVAYYTYSASPIRKKRTGAMSYSVSGVTEHDTYGNALSVKVNKGKLKGSVGGSAKLTVSVIAAQGKRVVSGAVRWYTSNARVATVSPSGRVMFKGKGKCYVYAKAHDGINSRNVRVEVS